MFDLNMLRVVAQIVAERQFTANEWRAAMLSSGFVEQVNEMIKAEAQKQGEPPKPVDPEGKDDATENAEGNAE